MKSIFSLLSLLMLSCLAASAQVVINPNITVGSIKPMNAVNNGPTIANPNEQTRGNFYEYKVLNIPYARTHDSNFNSGYGGPHTVDISALFPDFDRDPDDPSAYDFTNTDAYLKGMMAAGTQVFFRLGESIEHTVKKYNIFPPKDYLKWAKICEHVIRHYNEGWANGLHLGIKYWEIWNEPDLDIERWNTTPRTWGGTPEQFYDFYEVAAKYLDKTFPDLMIGGPALCWEENWADTFLKRMRQKNVGLDFFSWHIYERRVSEVVGKVRRIRAMLDRNGFKDVPSILNEWNYIKGWTDEFVYSLSEIASLKGAAYTSAVMSACQDEPVDMLMYYDFRPCAFNGAFDLITERPTKTYYAFYAWDKLVQYGTQVKATVDDKELYATAARSEDGRLRVLVTRYTEDRNITNVRPFRVEVEGAGDGIVYAYLTDNDRSFTEIPLEMKDGVVEGVLDPDTFVLLDFGH